ncbi:MAG: ATP-binding protein, partial [Chloroflexi bacterium]|nr:ATP-binding protein [Chloroflexota bacterium]
EKAIQIGLLPDMPWDRFHFLGNTSALGTYTVLTCPDLRQHMEQIASMMTYLELSADNTFTEEFTSAMFFPHTDLTSFPSVARLLEAASKATAATANS